GVYNEPGIANPRRAPDRHLGLTGDVKRRSAGAHWLHTDAGISDCIKPTFVADPLLGPKSAHQGDTLVEPWRPPAQADAERVELRLAVAQAHAEDVVATGQHVERGGFLGDMHRVERR